MTISTKTKIIQYMLEHKTEDLNIRDISKALSIDYKNCHDSITRLNKAGILKLQLFGNAQKVVLIPKMTPELFVAEHERKEAMLKKEPNLMIIEDYFERNLSTKQYVMLLFGSYAKGKAVKNSDIDLMFIISHASQEKEIQSVINMIPLKLHALVFTEQEFSSMKNSRLDTVGSEAIKHNIILHGIESYHEMAFI
jgi:predicted nucleotidyltransferase